MNHHHLHILGLDQTDLSRRASRRHATLEASSATPRTLERRVARRLRTAGESP